MDGRAQKHVSSISITITHHCNLRSPCSSSSAVVGSQSPAHRQGSRTNSPVRSLIRSHSPASSTTLPTHLDKLVIVDLAITVNVCLPNHLLHLIVRQLLTCTTSEPIREGTRKIAGCQLRSSPSSYNLFAQNQKDWSAISRRQVNARNISASRSTP